MAETSAWIEFDAALEPMPWGPVFYTVLRVPADLEEAARAARTRRVEGTLDDLEVNLAINRADVLDAPFLWAGQTLQRELGLRPGDAVRARLRPADPDAVPLPGDVVVALDEAGALAAFEALRPGERRRRLATVASAARPETRARRIAALVAGVVS